MTTQARVINSVKRAKTFIHLGLMRVVRTTAPFATLPGLLGKRLIGVAGFQGQRRVDGEASFAAHCLVDDLRDPSWDESISIAATLGES